MEDKILKLEHLITEINEDSEQSENDALQNIADSLRKNFDSRKNILDSYFHYFDEETEYRELIQTAEKIELTLATHQAKKIFGEQMELKEGHEIFTLDNLIPEISNFNKKFDKYIRNEIKTSKKKLDKIISIKIP